MDLKLKFKIIEKYGTQSRFARACRRNDNWVSRIVTGRQEPTKEERAMIDALLSKEGVEFE